jgi:hypothetical protein
MADSSFYYDPVDHMDQLRDVVVPVFAVRKGCNGERHPWHHWTPADCHRVDTATRLIFDNHEFVVYRFVSEEVALGNITKRLKKDPQTRFFIVERAHFTVFREQCRKRSIASSVQNFLKMVLARLCNKRTKEFSFVCAKSPYLSNDVVYQRSNVRLTVDDNGVFSHEFDWGSSSTVVDSTVRDGASSTQTSEKQTESSEEEESSETLTGTVEKEVSETAAVVVENKEVLVETDTVENNETPVDQTANDSETVAEETLVEDTPVDQTANDSETVVEETLVEEQISVDQTANDSETVVEETAVEEQTAVDQTVVAVMAVTSEQVDETTVQNAVEALKPTKKRKRRGHLDAVTNSKLHSGIVTGKRLRKKKKVE